MAMQAARGTPDACTPVSHHRRPCCWRSHGFGERGLSGSPPGRRAGTGLDVCRHPFLSPSTPRAQGQGEAKGKAAERAEGSARANQVPQSPRHAPLAEGGRGDRGEIRRARALEPAARRQQRQQGTRLIRQQGTRNSARPYAVVPRGHPRNHRRPPRALSLSSPSWPGSPPSAASHASW